MKLCAVRRDSGPARVPRSTLWTGAVLGSDSEAIWDLYAAGEVAGDVHGNNRLADNSLSWIALFSAV